MAGNSKSAYKKKIEKSHSRYITYESFQTSDITWYEEKDKWKKYIALEWWEKV